MITKEPPLNREDVTKIVGEVVGEIMNDALTMINQRFDAVDKRFDAQEKKLDAALDWLGNHEVRLRVLERANPSV